jgi:hypothetical protein
MVKSLGAKVDDILIQLEQVKRQQGELIDCVRQQGEEIKRLIVLTSSFTSSINLVAIKDGFIPPLDPSQIPLPPDL